MLNIELVAGEAGGLKGNQLVDSQLILHHRRPNQRGGKMLAGLLEAKNGAAEYFQWLTANNANNPPPAPNAANGWFRDAIYNYPGGTPPMPLMPDHSTESGSIVASYSRYAAYLHQAAIAHPNAGRGPLDDIGLMWEGMKKYGAEIAAVINEVLGGKDEDRKERVSKRVIQEVANAQGKQGGAAIQGEHMNGHISAYSAKGAELALQDLAPALASQDAEALKIARVLEVGFKRIQALSTEGHNPWLRAEWQLQLLAITTAVVATLEEITLK